MEPAEPPQLVVPEGLDTETEAVGARGPKTLERRRRRRFGIGFEGDLGVGREIERIAAGLDNAPELRRLEQRRRAAAKEDRVGGYRWVFETADVRDERVDIAPPQAVIVKAPVEIAVVTDGRAK